MLTPSERQFQLRGTGALGPDEVPFRLEQRDCGAELTGSVVRLVDGAKHLGEVGGGARVVVDHVGVAEQRDRFACDALCVVVPAHTCMELCAHLPPQRLRHPVVGGGERFRDL